MMWVKAEDGTFYNLADATEIKVEMNEAASSDMGWMIVAYFHGRAAGSHATSLATGLTKAVAERELQQIMSKMPSYHLPQKTGNK